MKQVNPTFWINLFLISILFSCQPINTSDTLPTFDQDQILQAADQYLQQEPVPLTNFVAERSEGGIHDFYSEGDYWWPNPDDPDGPYIRRDGQSNPDNFNAHREAMWDLSRWVASLVAAYKVTNDDKYANHALQHLRAWFINPETLMNPSLLYAQAIKGRVSGRGIGIIDTIHLIEVAKSIQELKRLGFLNELDFAKLQAWFDEFATWLSTHPYGVDERDHGNNHSTWWAAQVAAFAELAEREDLLELCRQQFKKLLTEQMDADGGFPDELERTKAYNYSLFNLEAYSVLAHIASTPEESLWTYETPKGSLLKAWNFMAPFLQDKTNWVREPDVEHFDELPIQSSGFLFAALAYDNKDWLQLWESLSPERASKEIDRTYPLRQPSLWIEDMDENTKPKSNKSARMSLYNVRDLQQAKLQFLQGKAPFLALVADLEEEASALLDIKPFSVMQKIKTPPSNDKHDYYSLGIYWWPNPDTDDGLPYVRHDGKRNPEYDQYDGPAIHKMSKAVFTLALAYFYTSNEAYATKANELIYTWFLNPDTKMNPHLEYGQAIPGITEGRGIGIIETGTFLRVINAALFLKDAEAFTAENYAQLQEWMAAYNHWLVTSEKGWDERMWHNNHGSSYDSQVASFSRFAGQDSIAALILDSVIIKRINRQIQPDGSQPWELERTKSMTYSIKNLDHLMENAILADYYGIDLWNYESEDGRSIKKAIKYLILSMLGEQDWEYEQIGGLESQMTSFRELIWVAHHFLNDPLIDSAFATVCQNQHPPLAINLHYPDLKVSIE